MDDVRSLDTNLWVIDHPFKMPGGIALGARSTIVRLTDGGLWLHSPGPLSTEARRWLDENGPVRAIVAPNLLHHLYLAEAVAAFPGARVYGPEGMADKVGAKLPDGVVVRMLTPEGLPWAGALEGLLVGGCPAMNEWVFLHPETRTLVLTDLAFNVQRADGLATRIFLAINGALGRFGPSRLARSFFMKDRAEVRKGIERILEWDFDRVVVSHGDVLETGGSQTLRESFAWLLRG